METGWPSIAASASMPPTPHPMTERPLTMVVWLSVPDQGIREGDGAAVHLGGPDHLGQVLQVHLVADPGPRRHDTEVVEGGLAPAQEGVALAVALELQIDVLLEGVRPAEMVDHDRVVDHQVDRRERVDLLRVAAEAGHGIAHRRQIGDGGNAGEVLHQDPCRTIGDLALGPLRLDPGAERLDVVGRDRLAVLVAQQILEQNLQAERQTRDIPNARIGCRCKAEVIVLLAVDRQGPAGVQGVLASRHALILQTWFMSLRQEFGW